nr:cytochrome c1-2, heme protein, mitochondrial-like [Osmia lignaria]
MAVAKVNRVFSVSRGKLNPSEKGAERRWLSIRGKTRRLGVLAGLIAGCGTVLCYLERSVKAHEHEISLPRYPWMFNRTLKSFDHAALRRGWQVYRTVCNTCHSLRYVRFMDLVDATHTREEAKAIAAEFEVEDGPDDQGNYFTRPAKLIDRIPPPYPNEEAARAANFGAYPLDLTFLVYARKRGIDYVFSLLTGFMEPPAGVRPEEGQYFNIYFPGAFTTMPQLLYQGMLEYDDGTPATESQMAKDVVEFLLWTASPEHDERKAMTIKALGIFFILITASLHAYRRYWSILRSQRLAYVPVSKFADAPPADSSTGECAVRSNKR